jgi:hypothetical protein
VANSVLLGQTATAGQPGIAPRLRAHNEQTRIQMAHFLPVTVRKFAFTLACLAFVTMASTASAGFHLWHVKEVFSNADGSVQFVEMFDSFSNENFVTGFTLSSNSDGVIKNFVFPADPNGNTVDKHMLITTPGFGSLSGAVAPDFTFDQGGVTGSFFNPNATNITISFNGSGDSMTFTGASLPKNGINSLTDAGASGFPPGTPSISSGLNSPTNFAMQEGRVNLSAPSPTGDYNGNHLVDGADYVVWRNTKGQSASPSGSGADGSGNGTVDDADYTFWRSKFGNAAGSGGGSAVPEPATGALLLMAILSTRAGRRRR